MNKIDIRGALAEVFVRYIPAVFGLASFIHWLFPDQGRFVDCFWLGCILIYVLGYQGRKNN